MSFRISDPLALLPYQTGLLTPPLVNAAAEGNTSLDSQQQTVVLGEPVPIVFCRRIDGNGGVFVSPKATEARFTNSAVTNVLVARLELVLSEGELPLLQVRDVFQRACRVGQWQQAYDSRAGDWNPEVVVVTVSGTTPWNVPYYVGTSGSYDNMTTLSYLNFFADGDTNWNKQVHVFVREGMQVTRIIDSVYGPSNNFIDLALYLIRQSSRIPEALIDSGEMLTAARFTDTNGLYFNGVISESVNLEDWLYETSGGFLLRTSERNGKKIFKPRLPINGDWTINTSAITPEFVFNEETVIPGSFSIEYIPLSERKSACITVLWRQQPDDDIGIIRTTEVRFDGEALNGPYEQYDLSAFCTSENHAVKVGVYQAARRRYITHNLRIRSRPDSFNSTLEIGDIVRVQLQRETDASDLSYHDFFYEVERISKATSGAVELDLTHFPIDDQNRSIIARQVAQAVGAGYVMPTGRTDFTCDDAGRRNDTSNITELPDPDPPVIPPSSNFEYDLPELSVTTRTNPITIGPDGVAIPGTLNFIVGSTGGENPSGNTDASSINPADPIAPSAPSISGITGPEGHPLQGDVLSITPNCPDGRTTWYLKDPETGDLTEVQQDDLVGNSSSDYTVKDDDIEYILVAITQCPDPASPDGYGLPATTTTGAVYPDWNRYSYVRWTGTASSPSIVTDYTTAWYSGSWSWGAYLTIGPMFGCFGDSTPLESSGSFVGPPIGPIPWRATVRAKQISPCGGGTLSLGGLGNSGNPGGCAGGSPDPYLAFGCVAEGSLWRVSGVWQYANFVDGDYQIQATWKGTQDYSGPE